MATESGWLDRGSYYCDWLQGQAKSSRLIGFADNLAIVVYLNCGVKFERTLHLNPVCTVGLVLWKQVVGGIKCLIHCLLY